MNLLRSTEKFKLIILGGLSGSNKSQYINYLNTLRPDLNVINADVVQSYRNFSIISSSVVNREPNFHLYNQFDYFTEKMNSFEFCSQIMTKIEPTKLNVIVGGTAFHLLYLQTKVLPSQFGSQAPMIIFNYDTTENVARITSRIMGMFRQGVIQEVIDFQKEINQHRWVLLKEKSDLPDIYPVGMECIRELIFKEKNRKGQHHAFIKAKLFQFITKLRLYAKTQKKFFKAKFPSALWIDVDLLPTPFHLQTDIEGKEIQKYCKDKPAQERIEGLSTSKIQAKIDNQIEESIQ